MSASEDVELIDYLLAPELTVDVYVEGEMPGENGGVAIDVCVSGAGSYAYGL